MTKNLLVKNDLVGYMFIKDKKAELFVLKGTKFVKAESEDTKDLAGIASRRYIIKPEKYNRIIGFCIAFKSDMIVFKTKNIEGKAKRNSGARCDQSGRAAVMKVLNEIFDDEDRYTTETLKRENNVLQLCSEEEFYLRYFNKIKKDGKIWFLSTVRASLNNIEKFNKD